MRILAQHIIYIDADSVEASYHIWKIKEVAVYPDKTIIKKEIKAKNAFIQACSYPDSYIEDVETGIKFYIRKSSLGLNGIKAKLNDKNYHEVIETYDPLPPYVHIINIKVGNLCMCSNIQIDNGYAVDQKSNINPQEDTYVAKASPNVNWDNSNILTNENGLNDYEEPVPVNNQIENDWIDYPIKTKHKCSDETFALIIANENYKYVDKVPFALNDGKTFKSYLEQTIGVKPKNIHYIEDATGNDIKYQLNWLKNIILAYQGKAKVLLYYSGHGIPNEKDGTAAILPVDGYASDFSTSIPLNKLYNSLEEFPSKKIVAFIDACFSGMTRDNSSIEKNRGISLKLNKSTLKGNIIVFSASQGNETAYAYNAKHHGMFTYFVLKAMKESKGKTNMGELTNSVITEVQKTSLMENDKIQSPSVNYSNDVKSSWEKWIFD